MSRKRSRSSSSSSASSSNHSSRSRSSSRSGSSGSSHSSKSSKKSDRSRSSSSGSSGSRSGSKSRDSSRSSRDSRDSRDSRSVSRDRRHRSRSRSLSRRRSKSPFNAKGTKIYVGRLSRNVNKDHINEIFCNYGVIKSVELPNDFVHPFLSRGFAYVEFEKPEEAEKAIKYMDGGQIDGQVINVSIAIGRAKPPIPRPYRRSGWRGKHSPPRGMRRRQPSPRRSPYRRSRRSISRSRSPRKRRGS